MRNRRILHCATPAARVGAKYTCMLTLYISGVPIPYIRSALYTVLAVSFSESFLSKMG
jgi:hypothetical protein